MKLFTNKEISKKIVIAILLVMSFNFISPTVSTAADDVGGTLFKPIAQLLETVADLVIKGLQKIFVGYGDIRVENPFGEDLRKRSGLVWKLCNKIWPCSNIFK